jgi:iron(III) transport system substrate-binding protein
MTSSRISAALCAALIAAVLPAQERKVVCYVSHDFEHAEVVLKAFTAATGIVVDAVSDTEDNKTIGLANRIVSEAGKPKGDVFWNNEAGQAVRLKNRGLLEPYVSPNAAAIPAAFKDPEGYWTGFGARARAIIYHKKLVGDGELPKRVADLADPKFKGKVVAAKPLTGSTLTHFAALAARDGAEPTADLLRRMIANEVQFEKGNAYVMQLVAAGVKPFGLTDTDDAYVSVERGDPVAYYLPDQGPGDGGVLLFPNTVMLLKGAARPTEARALIDFLLSPAAEELLAKGRAAQMPLHPGVPRPAHVRGIEEIKAMPVDWNRVGAEVEARFAEYEKLFAPQAENAAVKWGVAVAAIVAVVLVARRRRSAAA